VRWQDNNSFANFGFECWIVGLAIVLQCEWGFFLLLRGGEKTKKIGSAELHFIPVPSNLH